jgi:nitrous oxidase accessory protein NosD
MALMFLTGMAVIAIPARGATTWNVYPGPNAINNAIIGAAPGDTIYANPGIYDEQVYVNKLLTLRGALGAIIKPTGPGPYDSGIYVNTINGVVIEGFEINGIAGQIHEGIYTLNSNNVVIRFNKIHDITNNAYDNGGVGILVFGWAQATDGALIERNIIYNTARMGIFVGALTGAGWPFMICKDIIIKANEVFHAWRGPTSDYGGAIQINGAKNSVIQDNRVHHIKFLAPTGFYCGIYIYGSAAGNRFIHNMIYFNRYGLVVWISAPGGIVWGADVPTPPMLMINLLHHNALNQWIIP